MNETLSILTSLSEPSGLLLVGLALTFAAVVLRKLLGSRGLPVPPKQNSAAD